MVPEAMRAAFVRALGPADAIEAGELPVPPTGASEVLVAVETIAVNPVDAYVRAGRYRTPVPLPLVLGRDLVGTVVSAGSDALGFRPGERVWSNSMGHEGRQGVTAEYAAVPADRLYRVPDGADPAQLVALAQPAATAYLGWFVHARLSPGCTVYVGGGAGNIGSAAITLAHRAGARVVASARPADAPGCRAAGADAVVDYRADDLPEQVCAAAPRGVDVYWETSGHHDFDLVRAVVAPGATVLVTAAREPVPAVPLAALYQHDVRLAGFVISRASTADLAAAAQVVGELAAAGTLRARVADVLPLGAAREAHERIEAGTVRGRLLIDVRR